MEIAKTYQPENFEKQIYSDWEAKGFFDATYNQGVPSFSIALPPPNVTGSLHMGHAFQQTLMDCLTRYHRMMGQNTLWQPGTDHAGIATQMVVERKLAAEEQKTRHDLGREEFISRIWQWKQQSGGTITSQMRRLGTSVDWKKERFTMDEQLSRAVLEAFVSLYDEGLIYRGKRLVNWDPKLRTAISDLEVENREIKGSMWHIKYLITDGSKTSEGRDYLLVATTRPETLLGDTAVAVNPEDTRYIHLVGKEVALPLTGRNIKIVADPHADMTTGTGCVKITPAHDFNDYAVGKRHGLEMVNIMTEDAAIREAPEVFGADGTLIEGSSITIPQAYRGLDRFEARERIVADLKAQGLLDHIEDHTLAQPFGDRGGVPIEPMLTDQWYVKASVLGKEAIRAVEEGEIKFVPAQYSNMYFSWMRDLQDWCISRQLWWGHRIPAWYDDKGGIYVARNEEEVRSKYSLSAEVTLRRDEDVLDTWFSSALWTFSTLGWPDKTKEMEFFHPTSVLVTGFDIIFFWVARMIMMTMHFIKNKDGTPQVPFKTVYVTGLIRDEQGQKMSKSKGNIIDPIDMVDGIGIDELVTKRTANMMQPQLARQIADRTRKQFPSGIGAYGTDALRFTLCALASHGRDILWDMNRLEGYRNFCNKLWNAARFVQMNVGGYELRASDKADTQLANRYIKSKLSQAIAEAHSSIAAYRFDLLANTLYDFIWNEYCSWYLEFTKAIFRDGAVDAETKNATAYTLMDVLDNILRLSHPVIPFITEAVWQTCSGMLGRSNEQQTIMLCPYPKEGDYKRDEAAEEEAGFIKEFVTVVRNLRAELKAPPALMLSTYLRGASDSQVQAVRNSLPLISALSNVRSVDIIAAGTSVPQSVAKPIFTAEVLVEVKDLIDKDEELKRLRDMASKLETNIERGQARLENRDFISKAPEKIIQGAREQLELNRVQLEKIRASIAEMEKL